MKNYQKTLSKTKKEKEKPCGESSYFTVQSALLSPTDCLSKVTDPWTNVTSQSAGYHASGSNIVFLSPQLIHFFTDCLAQKTYQSAWGNQSWGDTIPDQSVVCESVVCDACKTPAVIAKPLDVLVSELFFIVGLFFPPVFLALILSLPSCLPPISLFPLLHSCLSMRTLESIDVRSASAVFLRW